MSESAAVRDLVTLLVFWISTYISSWLAEQTHLSPLLFYLIIGSVLGNLSKFDGFQLVENTPAIHFLSEFAITLVFLALGFEERVTHFMNGIKKAWGIASIGAIVPFCCGLTCSILFFPDEDIKAHLLVGLAVTATAVSLTMISLKSEGLALSRAAIGIMTSAVLDDVACLAAVAVMVPIASGQAEPTAGGIAWVIGKSLIFFAIIVFLNVFILPTISKEADKEEHPIVARIPFVRSIGIQVFIKFLHGEQATLATLIFGFGIGLLATLFGFHPCIGAYMAGLILEENYFNIDPVVEEWNDMDDELGLNEPDVSLDTDDGPPPNVSSHVKDVLESAAFCWIGPVFFLNLGSQIIIKGELLVEVLGPMFGFYVALFVGQILSAALAARYVPGGFSWTESWMIGFGMLGRAELFFVVLNVAYLENHIITEKMFFALTMAAMLLNVSVPICISLYKPYYIRVQHGEPNKIQHAVTKSLFDDLHKKATKDKVARDRRVFKPTSADPEADAVKISELRKNSKHNSEIIRTSNLQNLPMRVSSKDLRSPNRLNSKGTPARMSSKGHLRYSDLEVLHTPSNQSTSFPRTESKDTPPSTPAWLRTSPSTRSDSKD